MPWPWTIGGGLEGFLTAEVFGLYHLGAAVGENHAAARDGLVVGEDVDAGKGEDIGGLPGVVGDVKDRRWVAGKVGPS